MNDMTHVIKPKSDQLNADDLIGQDLTITITAVNISSTEQPVSVRFNGDNGKPFKPCKSMCRVMVQVWGADATKYVGKSMTLYRDPNVTWAGMQVGGIRISHMSHIDKPVTMALTASKQKRAPYTVKPLANQPAGNTPPAQTVDTDVIGSKFSAAQTMDDINAAYEELKGVWKSLNQGQKDEMTKSYNDSKARVEAAQSAGTDEVTGLELEEDDIFPGDR